MCDGDTKTVTELRTSGPPEVQALVKAVLDLNHVSKNVGKRFRDMNAEWPSGKCVSSVRKSKSWFRICRLRSHVFYACLAQLSKDGRFAELIVTSVCE